MNVREMLDSIISDEVLPIEEALDFVRSELESLVGFVIDDRTSLEHYGENFSPVETHWLKRIIAVEYAQEEDMSDTFSVGESSESMEVAYEEIWHTYVFTLVVEVMLNGKRIEIPEQDYHGEDRDHQVSVHFVEASDGQKFIRFSMSFGLFKDAEEKLTKSNFQLYLLNCLSFEEPWIR